MTSNLLPCPCCGGKPMEMQYDGILWVQCEDCALNTAACDASADYVQLWNRRATQPAAGEPVYQYRGLSGEWAETKQAYYEYMKERGRSTRILWTTPPAAAHGDEAVRKDAERYRWLLENRDGMQWENMLRCCDLEGQEAISEFIDAAMRAQGDGEAV